MIFLLAAVLALNSADVGTIGAAARELERDLQINHAQLGLLATASAGVGALAAVPMGVFADRVNRVHLLVLVVVGWAIAMTAGGLAPSYSWLLTSRLLLGAAVAASGPVVVSLAGDFIPPANRATVLGWILTGELAGAGIGLLAGGEIAAALSWRYAFFLLAAASLALAGMLWRWLPEPARGGADWPDPDNRQGQRCGERPAEPGAAEQHPGDVEQPAGVPAGEGNEARMIITARGIKPAPDRLLTVDAEKLSLPRAAGYLLGVPTIRLLIVASAIGYFFFAGLRTFAVVFAVQHFHVSQARLGALVVAVGLAALVGAVLSGRFTDRLLGRGRIDARILVAAAGYLAAALLLLPGFIVTSIALALPIIALGTAALAAANPPLDAARLDIVPGRLWGRAESLRTLLRLAAEALAPATFGLVADIFASTSGPGARAGGLQYAFLIMLAPLLASGLIVLLARRGYPVDVATATASDHHQRQFVC